MPEAAPKLQQPGSLLHPTRASRVPRAHSMGLACLGLLASLRPVQGQEEGFEIVFSPGVSCMLDAGGLVHCRGQLSPQLGRGLPASEDEVDASITGLRAQVNIGDSVGVPHATGLAAGYSHVCAVRADGNVVCWGANVYGQLGNSSRPTYATVGFGESPDSAGHVPLGDMQITHVAAMRYTTCVIGNDPSATSPVVRCFGSNADGACGLGLAAVGDSECIGDNEEVSSMPPVQVSTDPALFATSMSCGPAVCCVVLSNAAVQCWGSNANSLIGNGDNTGSLYVVGDDEHPREAGVAGFPPGISVAKVAVGSRHACAISSDGSLWAWGSNQDGAVGSGDGSTASATPVVIDLGVGMKVVDVAVADALTCAVLHKSGDYEGVKCWGALAPKLHGSFCGEVSTWGLEEAPADVPFVLDTAVRTVVAVRGRMMELPVAEQQVPSMCFHLDNTRWVCTGPNEHGAMPYATPRNPTVGAGRAIRASDWKPWSTSRKVLSLQHGGQSACALIAGFAGEVNDVFCFGRCDSGICGNGESSASTYAPPDAGGRIQFPGAFNATAIAVGEAHACAIGDTGSVRCWGDNSYGQLGLPVNTYTEVGLSNSVEAAPAVPLPAAAGPARSVIAGYYSTVVITAGGRVYGFGSNDLGLLGAGVVTDIIESPLQIRTPANRSVVTACIGRSHACFLYSNGAVSCAGSNSMGELGLADTYDRSSSPLSSIPTIQFGAGQEAVHLTCGESFTVAQLRSGSLRCWGNSEHGQCGSGYNGAIGAHDPVVRFPQVPIPPGYRVTDVAAGSAHACATVTPNTTEFLFADSDVLFCWGRQASLPHLSSVDSGVPYPMAVPLRSAGQAALSLSGVSAGGSTNCIVDGSERWLCFGPDNSYGQLGTSDMIPVGASILLRDVVSFQDNIDPTAAGLCVDTTYSSVLSSLSPNNGQALPPLADGGTLIAIRGSGLLAMSHLGSPVVMVEHLACTIVAPVTDSRINCVMPALETESDTAFTVTVRVLFPPTPDQSLQFRYIFADPMITRVTPSPSDGFDGNQTYSVFGHNLGSLAAFDKSAGASGAHIINAIFYLADTATSTSFGIRAGVCDTPEFAATAINQEDRLDCTIQLGGVGADNLLVLTNRFLPQQNWNVRRASAATFRRPTVQDLPVRSGPIEGGQALTILGNGFGVSADTLQSITIGGKPCAAVAFISAVRVGCITPPGVGANLSVVVNVGGQLSGSGGIGDAPTFSYNAPRISSIAPDYAHRIAPDAITSGLLTESEVFYEFIITGSDLANSVSGVRNVSVGGAPCGIIQVDSPTRIRCRNLDGRLWGPTDDTGASVVDVVITNIAGEIAALAGAFRLFGRPNITAALPAVLVPGSSFALTGENIGRSTQDVLRVAIAGSLPVLGCLLIASSNVLTCPSAPVGTGLGLNVSVLTRGGYMSADTSVRVSFAVGQAIIRSVSPESGPTAGGIVIEIKGVNLVPTDGIPLVAIGAGRCNIVSASSSQLRCTLPPGVGDTLIQVKSAGTVVTAVFRYDAPVLTRIVNASAGGFRTAGGEVLMLEGRNFGWPGPASLDPFSQSVRIILGTAAPCSDAIVHVERRANGGVDERVECRTPAGAGYGIDVQIVLGTGVARLPGAFSYSPPQVGQLLNNLGTTEGDQFVSIVGTGFGPGQQYVEGASIGGEQCTRVDWLSDTMIRCATPRGVGANKTVLVSVARQTNEPNLNPGALYSYRAPSIALVTPTYEFASLAPRNATFILSGADFGRSANDIQALTIGGVKCPNIAAMSPSQVTCDAMPTHMWSGAIADVVLTVGGQTAILPRAVDVVGGPVVSIVEPAEGNAGDVLVIRGANFGRMPSDVLMVEVGARSCNAVSWQSSGSIECQVPPGVGGALPVRIKTRGGLAGTSLTEAALFSYIGGGALLPPPFGLSGDRLASIPTSITFRWSLRRPLEVLAPIQFRVCYVSSLQLETSQSETCELIPVASTERITPNISDATLSHYSVRVPDLSVQPHVFRVAAINRVGSSANSSESDFIPVTCSEMQFLTTHLPLSSWACANCPRGAFCGGRDTSRLQAQFGFWRAGPDAAGMPVFVPCEVSSACPGVDATGAWVIPMGVPNATQYLMEAQLGAFAAPNSVEGCAAGYTGRLCQTCAVDYAKDRDGSCQKCREKSLVYLVLVAGVVGFIIVCSIMIFITIRAKGEPGRPEVALVKILSTHMQTLSLASGFQLAWPDEVRGLFSVFNGASSVSDEVLSIDCAFQRDDVKSRFENSVFFARQTAAVLVPVFALALTGLFWWIAAQLHHLRHGGEEYMHTGGNQNPTTTPREAPGPVSGVTATDASGVMDTDEAARGNQGVAIQIEIAAPASAGTTALPTDAVTAVARQFTKPPAHDVLKRAGIVVGEGGELQVTVNQFFADRVGVSMIVILFLLHFSLTKASLMMFSCRALDVALPGMFLVADLSIQCNTRRSLPWMYGVGVPAFALYAAGIPLAAFVMLYRRRRVLHIPHVREQYGFLYSGFKPHLWYYECVVAVRKVCFAVVSVLVAPLGAVPQTLCGVLVVVFALMIHTRLQPYSTAILNESEQASLVIAFLTLMGGLYITYLPDQSGQVTTSMVVIIVNAMLLAWFLRSFLAIALKRADASSDAPEPRHHSARYLESAGKMPESTVIQTASAERLDSVRDLSRGGRRAMESDSDVMSSDSESRQCARTGHCKEVEAPDAAVVPAPAEHAVPSSSATRLAACADVKVEI